MAQSRVAAGPSLGQALVWPLRRAAGNVRVTVALSVILIAGSFAAAAGLQMRNDRAHALAEAEHFDRLRAREIALDLSAALNRYESLGAAFANTATSAETSAALSEAGGQALRNIAVLDIRGQLQSELTGSPQSFLPLSPETLEAARLGRAVAPSRDGKSFAIVFGAGPHIVAVELDARALMPSASDEEALLATLDGAVVAVGSTWHTLPDVEALSLDGGSEAARVVDVADGRRLVALRRVEGWPLAAGASSRLGAALDAWYGALPLYFFFIFGPAIAGAALAVVFVREFERRARATEVVKNLRATRPEEARLLVRLAEAEKRIALAERARREFFAHLSHELRTPLNAIIGFSEVIEHGVFGRHAKYSEYARDIGVAGRELHTKIGDILDFADLEAGKEEIPCSTVDVVAILRKLVEEISPRAHAKGVRLTITMPVSADAQANTLAVRRVLSNLLDNAIHYSHAGTSVRVQVVSTHDAVMIGVRDRGVGFAAHELARLGEPFTRFDRAGCVTGQGMGIAVAMMLARRMGGDLRIASVQGEGATAEVRLARS